MPQFYFFLIFCCLFVFVNSVVEDGDVDSCGGDVVLVDSLPFTYDEYAETYSTCDLETSLWTCPGYIGKNLTTQGPPYRLSFCMILGSIHRCVV